MAEVFGISVNVDSVYQQEGIRDYRFSFVFSKEESTSRNFVTNSAINLLVEESNFLKNRELGSIGYKVDSKNKTIMEISYAPFALINPVLLSKPFLASKLVSVLTKKGLASMFEAKAMQTFVKEFSDHVFCVPENPSRTRKKQLEARGIFPGQKIKPTDFLDKLKLASAKSRQTRKPLRTVPKVKKKTSTKRR